MNPDVILKDEMTPRERMEAFSAGKPIDRVPCCPFNGESFTPYFGYKLRDFNHDSQIISDVVIKTFKMFGADNCSIGPGLHGLPEAMGAKLIFPDYDIPRVIAPAITDFDQISQLQVIDPYQSGRLHLFLEALKRIQDSVGDQVCIGNTIGGPFTTAAFLMGTEKFLKTIHKNPEVIHQLLEVATESTIAFMDAVMDLGISPGLADPIASCTMISPNIYKTFAMPYAKRCQDRVISRMGSGSVMHICGKTKGIWTDMVDTGITALSLDNCDDIGELKEAVGDRVTLVGNVDPVEVIMKGTKEQIEMAVLECIEKTKDSPNGFILASGCDIPIGTDPQKVHDFINAARKYGRR